MRCTVFGTGYLGATHAAGMAELGHEVIGVDIDPGKVAKLAAGDIPFYEPGLRKVLNDNLKVMDASAIALCRENNIPIVVFNIRETGNLAKVLAGDGVATIVQNQER